MYIKIVLLILFINAIHIYAVSDNDEIITIKKENLDENMSNNQDDQHFRRFPDKSYSPPYNPQPLYFTSKDMKEVSSHCDNGRKNLYLDWNESMSANYSCFEDPIIPDESVAPELYGDFIPPKFSAPHYCMETKINYPHPIVTYGGHRPLWGRYGEYKFIPKQRWLHNAEHGAVIMLYHPCANQEQVSRLRKLVTSCVYRHIITPYNLLPREKPLALITWGWYLGMNVVRPKLANRFIKTHALQGPVDVNVDGKYDYAFQTPAKIVSDEKDSTLCLGLNMM